VFGPQSAATFTGAIKGPDPGGSSSRKAARLFLDDIDDVPMSRWQVKLLRVLQEPRDRAARRLPRQIPVDVRVITGSKRTSGAWSGEGRFRGRPLSTGLNGGPESHPPASFASGAGRSGLPLLADHFIKRYFRQRGEETREISPAVMQAFLRYPWPGNVRELETRLRANSPRPARCRDRSGSVRALQRAVPQGTREEPQPAVATHARTGPVSLDERLREVESGLIAWALKACGRATSRRPRSC